MIELSDVQISGQGAWDLPRAEKMQPGTLFITQDGLSSRHIRYDTLSSDIKNRILSMIHVGSMAYMEPWQYSRIGHDHAGEYTGVSAFTQPVYGPGKDELVALLSVGDLSVENPTSSKMTKLSVYCPTVHPYVKEPAYGTIRFMYASSVPPNSSNQISSPDFDGWVYPDGQNYNIIPDQFKKGKNPFVTNEEDNPFIDGNKLKVPKLDRFIKANPFIEQTGSSGIIKICDFSDKPRNTAVAPHSHIIHNFQLNLTMQVDPNGSNLKLGTKTRTYDKYCVCAGGPGDIQQQVIHTDVTIKSGGVTIGLNPQGNDNPLVEPSHHSVVAMVYVGGRLKPYEKVYL